MLNAHLHITVIDAGGIDSFAAVLDEATFSVDSFRRLRNLIEQVKLADQVGLDLFGVGEHHRGNSLI